MPDSPRARRRLSLLVAGAVSAALLAPAGAQAAIAFTPCTPTGFDCGTLAVPLDRTGVVPGSLTLSIKRKVAPANPTRTAIVALAGGPGQAAIPIAADFAKDLAPGLDQRDLIVYDQRGTGKSSPLRCSALRTADSLFKAAEGCSREIGAARGSYRTTDSVADIEAIRVEGGYDKLVLYGVSYGTKVAEAYASAHPGQTAGLILDSVVTPEGPDAYRRSSLAASPRIVDEQCAAGRCTGITASASADLAKVAAKLQSRNVGARVYSPSGRGFTARLSEAGLVGILLSGDLNPAVRAELPGALRSAVTGDYQPLLRVSARTGGLDNGRAPVGYQDEDEADSDAVFLATTCEENQTFGWTRGAPADQRRTEAINVAKAIPAGSIGPFSSVAAYNEGIVPICLGWETTATPPFTDAPLPQVPALVIDGRGDVRTPLEDATAIAGRLGPGAQLLPVPNVGHSVLGQDPTQCASGAVAAFFAGAAVTQCDPNVQPEFTPTPKAPKSLAAVKPDSGVKGVAGKALGALRRTVNDAQRQLIGEALAISGTPSGAGGLRSGYAVPVKGGTRLVRYEYVPGIRVTGVRKSKGTSSFTVSGKVSGSVRVTQSLRVSGRLAGKRISTSFSARSLPRTDLTLAQAAALGRRLRAGA